MWNLTGKAPFSVTKWAKKQVKNKKFTTSCSNFRDIPVKLNLFGVKGRIER